MVSRREFLKTAAAAAAATAAAPRVASPITEAPKTRLRTITYNVYACQGWARAKSDPESKVKIDIPSREAIYDLLADSLLAQQPDIVTFQESPGEGVVELIAKKMEMNWTFFPSGQSWPGALITRFEIVESQNCPILGGERPEDLFTRHWGRAALQAPFGNLIVHSAHLHPGDDAVRTREVDAMIEAMRRDLNSGLPLLMQGDLNHTPAKPMYGQWKRAGLIDTFAEKGEGQPNTIKADTPDARIDYVWCHGPLTNRLQQTRVLFERPFRTDPDDPASWALSDHLPVMATFE